MYQNPPCTIYVIFNIQPLGSSSTGSYQFCGQVARDTDPTDNEFNRNYNSSQRNLENREKKMVEGIKSQREIQEEEKINTRERESPWYLSPRR